MCSSVSMYLHSAVVHDGRDHIRCIHLRQMKALMFDLSIQQENGESHVRMPPT